MHQYVGLRPERLLPVRVQTIGELIFVNLDPDAPALVTIHLEVIAATLDYQARSIATHWREYDADWKLLGQHLLCAEQGRTQMMGDEVLEVRCDSLHSLWCFPNLLWLAEGNEACLVLLQPTALGRTLCRIHLFTSAGIGKDDEQWVGKDWLALIHQRGVAAAEFSRGLQHSVPEDSVLMPVQSDPAGRWAQRALIRRVTAEAHYEGELKLYSNVRNYLL